MNVDLKSFLSFLPWWPNWKARWAQLSAGGWRIASAPLLVMVCGILQVKPARADMWAYVDAQGIAHFSASKLDERYELFFRGSESFTAGQAVEGDRTNTLKGGKNAAVPTKLLTYFEVSPNYKAVKYLLREASVQHGIDYELLQALIATESGFNAQVVSPKGAVGLMQLIPPTAQRYGVQADKNGSIQQKLTDPKTNIRAGSRYLRDLINMFPGRLELAIAAYNAGEGAVQRAGNKIPNYPETQNYVKTVMQLYQHLKPSSVLPRSGRVRMEMMGGVSGTGRATVLPAAPAAPVVPASTALTENAPQETE